MYPLLPRRLPPEFRCYAIMGHCLDEFLFPVFAMGHQMLQFVGFANEWIFGTGQNVERQKGHFPDVLDHYYVYTDPARRFQIGYEFVPHQNEPTLIVKIELL